MHRTEPRQKAAQIGSYQHAGLMRLQLKECDVRCQTWLRSQARLNQTCLVVDTKQSLITRSLSQDESRSSNTGRGLLDDECCDGTTLHNLESAWNSWDCFRISMQYDTIRVLDFTQFGGASPSPAIVEQIKRRLCRFWRGCRGIEVV
jgi:hypothetical protein